MIEAAQPSLSDLLTQGLELHQLGDLAGAEQVYLAILARDPKHADALHLLGALRGRQGSNAEGVRLMEQAIEANPRVSAYHNNLGNLRSRTGDLSGAEESYRQAFALNPKNADAYLNLGKLLVAQSRAAEARNSFLVSLQLAPRSLEAHMSLGRLEEGEEHSEAALQSYRNALRIEPGYAEAHLAMGNVYQQLEALDKAAESYKAALAIDPLYADACFNLGHVRHAQGSLPEAVLLYRRSIELSATGRADVYNNLGLVLSDLNQHADAETAYRKAIELQPDFDGAYFNLGKELATFGDEAIGIQMLERAIELNPANASAYLQLGVVAQSRGLLEVATKMYRRSLELDSTSRGARRNLGTCLSYLGDPAGLALLEALVREQPLDPNDHWTWAEHLLLHGDFEKGWEEYEWRMRVPELLPQHRSFDTPRWNGEPLEGKTIFVYAEQGQGDTLQFSRYVQRVAERGGKVVFEVQRSLQSLLKTLPGVSECIAQGSPLPEFETYAPLMSLPYILRTSADTIPLPTVPKPLDLQTLGVTHRDRLQVGIVWAGNPKHRRDRLRSTRLAQWSNLASIEGIDFTSLQAGEAAAQSNAADNPFRFVADCNQVSDFADTAAIISKLDLVITVDTAVAHLAGSMGRPVWILLYDVGDWRWGLETTQTPWYPSARLFRQAVPADWDSVLSDVAISLQQFVAERT